MHINYFAHNVSNYKKNNYREVSQSHHAYFRDNISNVIKIQRLNTCCSVLLQEAFMLGYINTSEVMQSNFSTVTVVFIR